MKKLLILGLLIAFACGEETDIKNIPCHSMTVSDANPVQFWPINCETWNESRPKGVHHYCFCQPWECNDEIKIEFNSDIELSTEQIVSHFNTDFNGWFNTANGVTPGTGGSTADWAWSSDLGGSLKVTTLNVFGTKGLRLSGISVPQQNFTIRVKFAISNPRNSSNLKMQLIIRDASNNQLLNQAFGLTSTGLEQTQDFIITDPAIWTVANHFWIVTNSTGYVAGDDLHITEISYLYDTPTPYRLGAYNEEDDEIFSIPFSEDNGVHSVSFTPNNEGVCDDKIQLKIVSISQGPSPLLSEWNNESLPGLTSWVTGDNPSFEIYPSAGDVSDALSAIMQNATATDYTYDYDISASGSGPDVNTLYLQVTLLKLGVQIGSTSHYLGTGTSLAGSINVTSSEPPDQIWLQWTFSNIGASYDVTLNSFAQTGPSQAIYKSDCLDIRTSHNESLLIDYTNQRNFAGIKYGDESPDPAFSIRIPAIFFETRFPQEGEETDLSSGDVIPLNSEVKEQRQISTDRMPNYMHRKIALVLQHQSLYIDGEYWVKGEEVYEKKEPANKRDSFRMYTCWLTRQDFVVRNVL
jgi:hypothetical protein